MSSNLNIVAMHRSEALQEELTEAFWQREELKNKFADALTALRKADPEGWSKWYDDKLPDFHWKDTEKVQAAIDSIYERLAAAHDPLPVSRTSPLKGGAPSTPHQRGEQ